MDFWAGANSIARLSRQIARKKLRPLGLTTNEGNVLLTIFNCYTIANQEFLTDSIDIDKATISRTVVSLESKGFIVRRISPFDRRSYELLPTRKALRRRPIIERIYHDIFLIAKHGLSPAEIRHSVKILSKISNNFNRIK
jgi:DNA-binding MarR family transcriptional regulator